MSGHDYSVRLSAAAERSIRCHACASEDGRETGGILLGRDPDARRVLEVTEAGGPGPRADRRPDFFLRDLEHARELGRTAWERDRTQWVGEWHTHPAGGSEPSERDISTYWNILDHPDLEFEAFVAVIVTPDCLRAWTRPVVCAWVVAGRVATPADVS